MYTAAVLTRMSTDLLFWAAKAVTEDELAKFKFETPNGDPLPHHMTINMGKFDEKLNPNTALFNKGKAILVVDQLRWSHEVGACAFRVVQARLAQSLTTEIKTINDEKSSKHITTCLMPGIKAFKSNDLFGEKATKELGKSIQFSNLWGREITVEAFVEECL